MPSLADIEDASINRVAANQAAGRLPPDRDGPAATKSSSTRLIPRASRRCSHMEPPRAFSISFLGEQSPFYPAIQEGQQS